ncbi:MAG: hypothetical protein OEV44_13745, partial [Spirochaetota bacterium]|nr:hypothetical protein [Spirochaetota bacterium]
SINKKLGFNKSIHESKSKKYPVVIYENVRHTKKIENEKGIDRLKHFFSDNYFKVAFSKDKIKIAYQYNYSGRGKIKPLNTIINSKKEKLNLVKGFPKATLLYIATSQLNSNNLYNWFINNWLLNSDERKVFNDTFDQIENNHQVEIRKLVKEEFGNELGVLITGIGYQGYNPFPKLALFVKVSKYAKPIEKMKRIFKYVYNTHTLTETRLHGVSVFYFQSNKRFGYTYSSYTKNTTSDYKEFSPSFAYSNGYMITTFNKSSMSAILYYLKSGKGVSETNSHKLFWQSVTQEYPFQIYISPDRLKQISKTYLNNLNNNEKDEFIYSDANKRLIPFLELLDRVEGIGGGFNFYNDRIEGELIIKLKK